MLKPILFNTQMVRAILEGRKTVTREVIKPRYREGDVLYVRETWAPWSRTEGIMPKIHYKADGENLPGVKWRPSIHMPIEAARIFLRVTDMRVERLQDITIDDALHEGADISQGFKDFARIWDLTIPIKDIEEYGWKANPWVVVISFEKIPKPENE